MSRSVYIRQYRAEFVVADPRQFQPGGNQLGMRVDLLLDSTVLDERADREQPDVDPELWRSNLALILDGLRAKAAHPLPVPALTEDQLMQAMRG
ncbi:hypothetical protein ACFVAV_16910 [Nocardia sp. NPDC057663]|uniref:hypothetical protein n=1 Tax=Nocardia sp. NPDC057663 TaxID=3346201 RepID=UPI0036722EC8